MHLLHNACNQCFAPVRDKVHVHVFSVLDKNVLTYICRIQTTMFSVKCANSVVYDSIFVAILDFTSSMSLTFDAPSYTRKGGSQNTNTK